MLERGIVSRESANAFQLATKNTKNTQKPMTRMNSFFFSLCSSCPLWLFVLVCAFAPLGDISYLSAAEPEVSPVVRNAAKIVGSDQCAKCHEKEVQQWMRTPHFATFDTLHRLPQAKEIADRLGLGSIKRNETCGKCHYTEQNQEGRNRVVAGVSCESCHGAAKDWIAIHADYGGPNATKASESTEHRAERLKASIDAGMNNPHNNYLVARQCYGCHTVPDERLVNVGQHVAGSQDFELVAWSQGIVRHNFLRTGGTANGALSPAELRVMYVVGVLADLEYSLRAVALATDKAPFGVASAQRAARMKQRLHEIQRLVSDPLLASAIEAVATVELRLGNSEAIKAAADGVGTAAYRFADEADGNRLEALDPLIPKPKQYKN
jgi:Cytochrome c554 and c-prime